MQQDQIEKPARQRVKVRIRLLNYHVDYLEYVADQDDLTMSKVVADILDAFEEFHPPKHTMPTQKDRVNITLSLTHDQLLDRLSARWGVSRSEVARRLIDRAARNRR